MKKEWLKLEYNQNKPILHKTKMYSTVEEKFVDFDIYILIQRGDENSLLKRGVYFNMTRTQTIPNFLVKASQLQSINEKHAQYNNEKGGIMAFDPSHRCHDEN